MAIAISSASVMPLSLSAASSERPTRDWSFSISEALFSVAVNIAISGAMMASGPAPSRSSLSCAWPMPGRSTVRSFSRKPCVAAFVAMSTTRFARIWSCPIISQKSESMSLLARVRPMPSTRIFRTLGMPPCISEAMSMFSTKRRAMGIALPGPSGAKLMPVISKAVGPRLLASW